MAATFLQLHNRLRAYLREEQISALAATDLLSISLSSILNGAMRQVLDAHSWSFLLREDGVADFDRPYSGTSCWTTAASTTVEIETNAGVVASVNADNAAWRFALTSDTAEPNLTYKIVSATGTASDPARDALVLAVAHDQTLTQAGSATWLVFAHELALPDTVSRVHSVWDESGELTLVFDHQSLGIDPSLPRRLDMRGNPDTAVVGGIVTNSGTSPSTGLRLAIYPIPEGTAGARYLLYYRYAYRFADLSLITDTLTGVPDEIADLIVRRAFIDCLMGNVQNDPQRGNSLRQHLEVDLQQALARDVRDPLRRMVPQPFGSGRRGSRHLNQRWANRQVPTP